MLTRCGCARFLLNLLSNAGKFTAAGSVTLGVQAEPDHLHIWVEDTGSGIAPNFQQRIFEAFSTAELPKRAEQGIGLGLRVTYELVKLHNGVITLESTPGIGTTVHVRLPLLTAEIWPVFRRQPLKQRKDAPCHSIPMRSHRT